MRRFLFILVALLAIAPFALAQETHVVPGVELEQTLEDAAATRRQNEADLERLMEHEEVEQAAAEAGLDLEQVRQAVPQLDDETLAELSARARELENDIAGGFIGGIVIMLILILIIAVLLAVYVID
ncbi:MAG: PA2779 family protein [Bryobacterales bacterium]|nr:PA2779 family protein [Acidobacteriota bacterium]MCB9383761.1 PA2779 family protein [Bryobacterales bacterium]